MHNTLKATTLPLYLTSLIHQTANPKHSQPAKD
jgi:hypothetical protein